VDVLLDRHTRECPECGCRFTIYWPVAS
jgi:transcriptional regulator NrdR family protein